MSYQPQGPVPFSIGTHFVTAPYFFLLLMSWNWLLSPDASIAALDWAKFIFYILYTTPGATQQTAKESRWRLLVGTQSGITFVHCLSVCFRDMSLHHFALTERTYLLCHLFLGEGTSYKLLSRQHLLFTVTVSGLGTHSFATVSYVHAECILSYNSTVRRLQSWPEGDPSRESHWRRLTTVLIEL